MLEVPDVDFIRPCGVVVLALFYCHLDLCCGECYVGCLQFECVHVYVSVCKCVLCLTVLVNCERGPKKLRVVWDKFEHWWNMAAILYRPTLQALSFQAGFT